MADNSDLDTGEWATFLQNNEELISVFDRCCYDVADIITNINEIKKSLDASNSLIPHKYNCYKYIPIFDDNLSDISNEMLEYMYNKTTHAIEYIAKAQNDIEIFDVNGVKLGDVGFDFASTSLAYTSILGWAIVGSGFTRSAMGLGYILGLGSDLISGDVSGTAANIASTAVWQAIKKGLIGKYSYTMKNNLIQSVIPSGTEIAANMGVGLFTSCMFTCIIDFANDLGDFTSEDWASLAYDAVGSMLQWGAYYASYTITTTAITICASSGYLMGQTVSPAGAFLIAAIGAVVGYLVGDLVGKIWTEVRGDQTYGTFTLIDENGMKSTYEVPKSGNGGLTHDAISAYVRNQKEESVETPNYYYNALYDNYVNDDYYRMLLHSDKWEEATRMLGIFGNDDTNNTACQGSELDRSLFNSLLDELVNHNFNSDDEIYRFIEQFQDNLPFHQSTSFYTFVYGTMFGKCGFDPVKYYEINHVVNDENI